MAVKMNRFGLYKYYLFIFMVSLFLLISFSRATADGGMHSGGADLFPIEEGSAWYTGENREVSYCYVLSSKFGVTNLFVEQNLQEAFTIWKEYVANLALTHLSLKDLSLKFNLRTSCQGADLKFFFGGAENEIKKRKSDFFDPLAFVQREKYDPENGWSQGFVWLTDENQLGGSFPNYRKEKFLLTVLLHEIGHIFGIGHISETIMDERISHLLRGRVLKQNGFLGKINWSKTLASEYISCDGELGDANESQTHAVFKKLFFRLPVGKVVTLFTVNKEFSLRDELEEKVFKIDIEPKAFGESPFQDVFKVVTAEPIQSKLGFFNRSAKTTKDTYLKVRSIWHQGRSYKGSIQVSPSETLNLILSLNLNANIYAEGVELTGPVRIDFVEHGEIKNLFTSKITKQP